MDNGAGTEVWFRPKTVDSVLAAAESYRVDAPIAMYSACIYCSARLGTNWVLESFPVGRRIAFDAMRGRLWVVCGHCGRWNLSPLQERWETLEQCERLYRGTRLRLSTDNVGLARLSAGLDLVRIGAPLRPELAAWRYGPVITKRRVRVLARHLGFIPISLAIGGGYGSVVLSVPMLAPLAALPLMLDWTAIPYHTRRLARIRVENEPPLELAMSDAMETRVRHDANGWYLDVPHIRGGVQRRPLQSLTPIRQILERRRPSVEVSTLEGADARRAAGLILPLINQFYGTRDQVRRAVDFLESTGTVERCFATAAATPSDYPWLRKLSLLRGLPTPVLLAMEMAAHEESERRALEGELSELEAAWRDAEEIASIADDLLLPTALRSTLASMKGTADPGIPAARATPKAD